MRVYISTRAFCVCRLYYGRAADGAAKKRTDGKLARDTDKRAAPWLVAVASDTMAASSSSVKTWRALGVVVVVVYMAAAACAAAAAADCAVNSEVAVHSDSEERRNEPRLARKV